ncbi:MAG: hypothetical protein GY714_17615 [Desulfobacterales bacterium]|nr:hypothetical protein [Desulfobacterales bacterium]
MNESHDIESYYLEIIQPLMYEVGILWGRGDISVAQEHLASANVLRVIATTSLKLRPETKKGSIVITSAPNNFHKIDACIGAINLTHPPNLTLI